MPDLFAALATPGPPKGFRQQCLVGVLCALGATLIRLAADPLLQGQLIFSWYLVAVVLASALAGPWSGAMASVVSALAADTLFAEPRFVLKLTDPRNAASMLLFLLAAAALVWTVSRWSRAVTKAAGLTSAHARVQGESIRWHRAVECSGEAIFVTDADGVITYVNPEFTKLYGYAAGEVVGRATPRILKSGVIPQETYEQFWRTLLAGQTVRGRLVNRAKDGRLVDIDGSSNPIIEPDGKVVGFLGVQRDITERRREEKLLAQVMAAVESTSDAIGISDVQGHHVYQNSAMTRLFEYASAEEMQAAGGGSVCVKDPAVARDMFDTIMGGASWAGELDMVTRTGRVFPAFERANPVRDEHGNIVGLVGIITDITERKALESRLAQAQKMESVGRLAGGVAHDFNNLLTVILGHTELLIDAADPHAAWRADALSVRQAAESATALTRQLLAFSRKQVVQLQPVDLGTVVAGMARMLQRLIGEDVECRVMRPDPARHMVLADPGQIEQVVLNLAVNARDAMPGGGTLTIETAAVDVDATLAGRVIGLTPGRYITLRVSDTGVGMGPDVQAHLFEPFFTTKERGKGTGLGLATVYGIVKQHGGSIAVESRAGAGATFTLYLPECTTQASAAADVPAVPAASGRATETVLVVDDDAAVRSVMCRVLQGAGYRVLPAASGDQALHLADAHAGPIDVLVTDVVMPRMDGRALSVALRGRIPASRVLFVSGYTDDALGMHGVVDSGMPLLVKPFGPAALLSSVERLLHNPASPTQD